METKKLNENPTIFHRRKDSKLESMNTCMDIKDDDTIDPFTSEEIFDLVRDIQDPEHPLTLEQLNVLECKNIHVNNKASQITVLFTPTIPHCSMSVSLH